jgi:hypothetical protein
MTVRCRTKLPGPEIAGFATWDVLRDAAEKYPDLRPCPKQRGSQGSWLWIEKKVCGKCTEAVRVGK